MQTVKQHAVIAKFKCLGADCPDTCCHGWDMPVDSRQRELYAQAAPELLASMDADKNIMKREGRNCAQLCEGHCNIHARYGEDFLGDTCYFYPRLIHRVGETHYMSGAISCPEMLRLILSEPKPFALAETTIPRMPISRRDLTSEGYTIAQAEHTHAECMAIADESSTAEIALNVLLAYTYKLPISDTHESKPSDPHALYYALALTEAFGTPGISTHLADIMRTIEQQLDCHFDRTTREYTLGPNASKAYPVLLQRWRMDAETALAPTLRRWLQAQIAMTFFPFGGVADATIAERMAILIQRFATIRLALMCHVSPAGIPPNEPTVIHVIQAIARFMDHLADARLTRMIHRDSGWESEARLRGLVWG